MIMMHPPTTIVFRRPSRSPSHRLDRAPIKHPISYMGRGVSVGRCKRISTDIDGNHKTLQRCVIWMARIYDHLGEDFFKLTPQRQHEAKRGETL